jgi:hypothetical protein
VKSRELPVCHNQEYWANAGLAATLKTAINMKKTQKIHFIRLPSNKKNQLG